ncbi:probable GTP diphosphokinase RSH3, chloroplastic [Cryptomeria japonica]|uniref:probable GTP diphosphokinase RSH3, chloroplastic n=1 Tax=Cryptomeria japonica TaxID=3369 RepID=UPI0027D9D004|nr:probable GTP diphosphokinase RSH3, chloroplastic [Cryptomeria japonica]
MQVRASGDPYLRHCVETSIFLAMIGSRENVIIAGLLHDTLDDTSMDYSQLFGIFGKYVADLVQGVSRLSLISQFAHDNNTISNSVEADRLHTMFLAMMDVRVVLIKLADRLHSMRTLGALSLPKQQGIAKETLEIFAPLANRLGIWSWKAELEDLCFKYLNPHKYQELSARLSAILLSNLKSIVIMVLNIKCLVVGNLLLLNLYGRPKSLYNIYLKMLKKKQKIDEINDLCGLRLIVLNEKECYDAHRIVHHLWQGVPGEMLPDTDWLFQYTFRYQSLHTVVWGEDGHPLEIQIRTKEMHQQGSFVYKEGEVEHSSSIVQMVEWARWVLSEMMDTKLRLSYQESSLRSPCPFPFHKDGWPHMDKFCELPFCTDENLFVIVLEDDKCARSS